MHDRSQAHVSELLEYSGQDIVATHLSEIERLVLAWLANHGFRLLSSFAERHDVWEMRAIRQVASAQSPEGMVHLVSVACDVRGEGDLRLDVWAGASLQLHGKSDAEHSRRVSVGTLPLTPRVTANGPSSKPSNRLSSEWEQMLASTLRTIDTLDADLRHRMTADCTGHASPLTGNLYTASGVNL